WAQDSSRVISDGLDRSSRAASRETPRRKEDGCDSGVTSGDPARAGLRRASRRARNTDEPLALPASLGEAAASLRRSRGAVLLASLGDGEGDRGGLEFGLPVEEELFAAETLDLAEEFFAAPEEGAEPFEVRVGSLGWTGVFRREVELGRAC